MKNYAFLPFGNILLVKIDEGIEDHQVHMLESEITKIITSKKIKGVIFNLSGVEVIDSFLATHINKLSSTIKIMNVQSVIVGLSVPVILTLLDFGIHFRDIQFAFDIEGAILKISQFQNKKVFA